MNPPPPAAPLRPELVRYDFRGATVDVPREWEEESILTVRAPGPGPQPAMTLSRSSVASDITIELFASRKVAELARNVTGLRVEETRETVVAGHRAVALRLFWEEVQGRVFQRLVCARVDDSAYVLAGSCLETQTGKLNVAFDGIVASLRFPASIAR